MAYDFSPHCSFTVSCAKREVKGPSGTLHEYLRTRERTRRNVTFGRRTPFLVLLIEICYRKTRGIRMIHFHVACLRRSTLWWLRHLLLLGSLAGTRASGECSFLFRNNGTIYQNGNSTKMVMTAKMGNGRCWNRSAKSSHGILMRPDSRVFAPKNLCSTASRVTP